MVLILKNMKDSLILLVWLTSSDFMLFFVSLWWNYISTDLTIKNLWTLTLDSAPHTVRDSQSLYERTVGIWTFVYINTCIRDILVYDLVSPHVRPLSDWNSPHGLQKENLTLLIKTSTTQRWNIILLITPDPPYSFSPSLPPSLLSVHLFLQTFNQNLSSFLPLDLLSQRCWETCSRTTLSLHILSLSLSSYSYSTPIDQRRPPPPLSRGKHPK